jgi:hypothetical protein
LPIKRLLQLTSLVAAFAALFFATNVTKPVSADVGPLTASSTAPPLGGTVTITGQITPAGPLPVTASASTGTFQSGNLSPGGAATGTGTNQLIMQAVSAGPATVSLTYVCSQAGAVTFTVGYQGAASQTITVNCGGAGAAPAATPVTTAGTAGSLTVVPDSGTGTTVTGQCNANDQLQVTGQGYFTSVSVNGVAVTSATGSSTATCQTAGVISASVICTSQGVANFQIGNATGHFTCTAAGGSTCGAQTSPTGVPLNQTGCVALVGGTPSATASGITIAAAPTTVGCSGTSAVTTLTIQVNGANGAPVADKTAVTVTSSAGVVSAPSLQTLGGKAQTPFTAPSSGTSVTITATAAGATGTGTVALSCGGSTSSNVTTPPPPAVGQPVAGLPPAPPPPPVAGALNGNQTFRPPNTGDAGLKALEGID